MSNEAGQNLYEQSNAAYTRGDKVAGRRLLNAAFQVNRALAGPWYQLGIELAAEGKHGAAVAALRRAAKRGVYVGLCLPEKN
jgi:hypothetical protein